MENSGKSSLILGENPWESAFQRFDDEAFFSQLHELVKNRSYYERYLGFKKTINLLSYLFSFASAITSAYAVYWLAKWAGAYPWLAVVIGLVILIFLEKLKRKASVETWRSYFFKGAFPAGWLTFSIVLFGIGVFASSFGAKEGAADFAPPAALVKSDSLANFYRTRIAALEAENATLSRQRNHLGEIFWPAQRQMAKNKEIIAQYELQAMNRDSVHTGTNTLLQSQHDKNVSFASYVLMIIQIIMELAFEGCIAYVWYFFYRVYIEHQKTAKTSAATPPPVPAASSGGIAPAPLPGSPTPSTNGHTTPPIIKNESLADRMPIGFYTEAQRAAFSPSEYEGVTQEPLPSVQVCTGLYREENTVLIDDPYTVLHEYQKSGKVYVTPYTENQILSRIAQYQRDIEEAEQKQLDTEILENRKNWLLYWQGKLTELHQKQQKAGIKA